MLMLKLCVDRERDWTQRDRDRERRMVISSHQEVEARFRTDCCGGAGRSAASVDVTRRREGQLYVIPRNSSLPYRRQARFSHGKRGKRGQEGKSRRGRFDWWSRAGPGVGAVKLVMGCGIDKVARVKDMTMSLLFGLIELIHWLRSSLVGFIE